jgi:hypothetical protein
MELRAGCPRLPFLRAAGSFEIVTVIATAAAVEEELS